MIFRWYLQNSWAATSSSRHHRIYFFSDLYKHTKTSGLEVCPMLVSPRDRGKLLIQLQDAIIHPLCMAVCGTVLQNGWDGIDHVRSWISTKPSTPSPSAPGAALCSGYQLLQPPMSFAIHHPEHRKLTEWKTCQVGKEMQRKQAVVQYTGQVKNHFYYIYIQHLF